MFEEYSLGLEVTVEPTADHIDMLSDEGIFSFLCFIRGCTVPTSTMACFPVFFRARERTKADEAMCSSFLCEYCLADDTDQ